MVSQYLHVVLSISTSTLVYHKLKNHLPGSGRERKHSMRVCVQIEARTYRPL